MTEEVPCQDCPLFGLRLGSQLELYYTVELDEWPAPKKIWFPCVVKRLRLLSDNRGTTVDGHIEFERSTYFTASTSHMVFLDKVLVRDDSGEEIPWRHANDTLEIHSNLDSGAEHLGEESGVDEDMDYQPENINCPDARCEKKRKVEEISLDVKNARSLAHMKIEMEHMKREMRAQKSSLEIMRDCSTGNTVLAPQTKPEPLLFTFARLERFLVTVPTISASERRLGAAVMKQCIFTCNADCSLQSLDAIVHRVQTVPATRPELSPVYDQVLSSVPEHVMVKFSTLQQLLSVYGPLRQSSTKDLCVLNKHERGTSNAVLCRVIGCSAQRIDDDSSPYLLSIGEHLGPVSADDHTIRNVLYRENCSWNNIECNFQHSLVKMSLTETELAQRLGQLQVQRQDEDTEKTQSLGFTLSWKPFSDVQPGVFQNTTRDTILGTLTLQVPYVLVWGDSLLTEVHHLLRGFFKK